MPDYWIIDDQARLIERWPAEDSRPEILSDELVWQPEGAPEPLIVDIPGFFFAAMPESDG